MADVNSAALTAAAQAAPKSRLSVIRDVTLESLDGMTDAQLSDPKFVEGQILADVHAAIDLENAMRAKNDQWRHVTELMPSQIADILLRTERIVRVAAAGKSADEDHDLIAVYQYDGDRAGTYVSSEVIFRKLIRRYNYNINLKATEEVMAAMMENLPRVNVCRKRNLVAVNNGIFDFDTKKLMPFTPELVFLTKSGVDYVDNPVNPVIHNPADGTDWDVESWMKELSDDPDIVGLLWEILGAIIRPLVPWNKSAWFYSEKGNNGKGTLCELMEQLCGEDACVSIPLTDFGKEFRLEPLLHASAIITHENDVGAFIDKAANMKAVVTGDMISINRKYKAPVSFVFRGFMVQCVNEYPRVKDKSDSFFRRQLFVPFTKCFTGMERKYIKDDYLHRPEVLQYVLWRVLNMDYYSLSEPEACGKALDEYREFNDPIRQFLNEFMPRFQWSLLPFEFLYDLYKSWYKDVAGSDRNQRGKSSFVKDVKNAIEGGWDGWEVCMVPARPGVRMQSAEPLIMEYDLARWKNPVYKGTDPEKLCHPRLMSSYRGLRRLDGGNASISIRTEDGPDGDAGGDAE